MQLLGRKGLMAVLVYPSQCLFNPQRCPARVTGLILRSPALVQAANIHLNRRVDGLAIPEAFPVRYV